MVLFELEFMIIAIVLVVLMLVCFARILLGPTIPDRVVALDTINTLVIAFLVILGAAFNAIIYIDVAIVYALLSFVSTLFISNYLEAKA